MFIRRTGYARISVAACVNAVESRYRMTKLIVNADDFGYSEGVNYGILAAFKEGIVTSTTLMVNMPGAKHAAQLAKAHPELGVGIHFVLTCGTPISQAVPSLVNNRGEFHSQREWLEFAEPTEIEREWTAQLNRFFSFGLTPTHIDSHHHVHGHEKIVPIVARLAAQYDLPVRKVPDAFPHSHESDPWRSVNYFSSDFYGEGASKEQLIQLFDRALDYETVEIMCHPAFVDVGLLDGSSYNIQRVHELNILTDPEIRLAVEMRGLELATYRACSKRC